MARGILLIEDEQVLAKNVKRYLERHGYETLVAETAAEGIGLFDQSELDLVLLDLNLPDMHGIQVLNELRSRSSRAIVICITGHGSVQTAVEAMKGGAYDYLTKPIALSELKILIDKAFGQERLESALTYYNSHAGFVSRAGVAPSLDNLIGEAPSMVQLRERIRAIVEAERSLVEGTPPAVLIRGETGTGKELVARALHFEGSRRNTPFIELNCAALPMQLLESELFGYERGAFTDAKERKIGLVESAHGGTLFLDEIGDIEIPVQLKLLKLLEDRQVRRVGGVRDRVVDVRFISATNRPLEDLIRLGQFRSDLYYRLRVVTIDVPPLRARSGDAELLAKYFLAIHERRYGRSGMRFSDRALERIRKHLWPGNVRELRNAVEQAILSTPGDVIGEQNLGLGSTNPVNPDVTVRPLEADETADLATGLEPFLPGPGTLDEVERSLIGRALDQSHGNVTRAAKILGISRDTLRYRIEKHKIG
jgi:two-component system, NtrC family, response regulator AtoC